MSVHATVLRAKSPPQRRGACPGLSAPMSTGDGLLARLLPIGTIPLGAFAELSRAARTHGNGIVEVTTRGSIQVRGLSAASASHFAAAVAALKIAAADGIPVLINPLAGLDAEEIFDAGALAADLRVALAQRALAASLAAKISVVIDGGDTLNLDAITADVRLRAEAIDDRHLIGVMIGGDGTSSIQLGRIAISDGVEVATRLLDVLAQRGRDARARNVLAAEGLAPFRSAVADMIVDNALQPVARSSRDLIGLHRLRDGSLACGVGLAFGHADAAALEHLADAAAGADGLRAAHGRALLAIGLTDSAAASFTAAAERLGFIVRADDPRRYVAACAGAPICASAHIAARALGPLAAQRAAPYLDDAFTIHISGCAKGCAHAGPAALTVVGTPDGCALVANGSSRDVPFASVAAPALPAAVAQYARTMKREAGHG